MAISINTAGPSSHLNLSTSLGAALEGVWEEGAAVLMEIAIYGIKMVWKKVRPKWNLIGNFQILSAIFSILLQIIDELIKKW